MRLSFSVAPFRGRKVGVGGWGGDQGGTFAPSSFVINAYKALREGGGGAKMDVHCASQQQLYIEGRGKGEGGGCQQKPEAGKTDLA